MDTRQLLDQLLHAGRDTLSQTSSSTSGQKDYMASMSELIKNNGGGLAAGGVLGLLLGTKRGRKQSGRLLKYGSLAALGVMAYKAYNHWQAQQPAGTSERAVPLANLTDRQVEQHSQAVLCAMIAAAKADGHIDTRERELIDKGLAALTQDETLRRWFDAQLNQPLDPAAVAQHSESPEMASEMYLASLLVVDEQNYMERAYLDELARQLGLSDALQQQLAQQVADA